MPVRDQLWAVDSREDVVYLVTGVFVVGVAMIHFTTLDGHVRFLAAEGTAYLSPPPEDVELKFQRDQVALLNRVSDRSLGLGPADERLYCFTVQDGEVTKLHLADNIKTSRHDRVAGGCVPPVDGTVHTHPGGDREPSEEDRTMEGDLTYMCIQYDEVVLSPTGVVGGLDCYKHRDGGLQRAEVGIAG